MISSPEPERERSFGENLGLALLECLAEALELLPLALVLGILGLGMCLVGSMVYHLMFDPNAVDVAARLDALSIDPDKWILR